MLGETIQPNLPLKHVNMSLPAMAGTRASLANGERAAQPAQNQVMHVMLNKQHAGTRKHHVTGHEKIWTRPQQS